MTPSIVYMKNTLIDIQKPMWLIIELVLVLIILKYFILKTSSSVIN